MNKRWFQKAVMKKSPYSLGGWRKTMSAQNRRRLALSSRPSNWTIRKRELSTGRALQALANVTKDKPTKRIAMADARYFYRVSKRNKRR